MKPTEILRAGGGGEIGKYNKYLGDWGNFGSQTQKGIITYGLSANRQRPMAGVWNAVIFNTFRRVARNFFYVVPPFVVAYYAVEWANKKNEYLNSKAGRLEAMRNGGGGEE